MTKFLTTVMDAEHSDGQRWATYAYVDTEESVGVAVEFKRALEMERSGVPYKATLWTPDEFKVWFAPDFPVIGKPR